jgi:hypothetical protein
MSFGSNAMASIATNLASLARRVVGEGANNLVALDAMGKLPAVDGSQLMALPAKAWDLVVEDQKASGVGGGSTVVGWQTRVLNTVVTNTIGASLSSNVITFAPGSYEFAWEAMGYSIGAHRTRLYNTTLSAVIALGMSGFTNGGYSINILSSGVAQVRFAGTTAVRLDNYAGAAYATNGFGYPSSTGDAEIYARLCARKLS